MVAVPKMRGYTYRYKQITPAEWVIFTWEETTAFGEAEQHWMCTGYRSGEEAIKLTKSAEKYEQYRKEVLGE